MADLAAVASVAASGSGSAVFAFGYSSGGALVLRAAAAGVPSARRRHQPGLVPPHGAGDRGGHPRAKLVMMEGYDHGAPPEVIAPVPTEFFLG